MRRDGGNFRWMVGGATDSRRLSMWAIGFAVAIGLFALPMFSAYLIISDHRSDLTRRAERELDHLVGLVAEGMRQPVWQLNPAGGAPLVRSLEHDPRFVAVEVISDAQGVFLSYRRPVGPDADPVELRAPVVYEDRVIGEVRTVVDAKELHAAGDSRWLRTVGVLVVQLLFGVSLVGLLVWLVMRLSRNRALQEEIDERRRYADALKKSERHLRDIVNAMPMSVFYVDTDFRLSAANRICCEWWGFDDRSFENASYGEVFGAERQAVFESNMRRTFRGEAFRIEATLDFPDGAVRDVEIYHVPDIDARGDVRGAFVITQDVTSRKRADRDLAAFRMLMQETIDAAPISITIKDREQRYVFANRTACEKLDLGFAAKLIGRTIVEALPDYAESEFLVAMMAGDTQVLETGEPIPFTDYENTTFGEVRHQFVSKTPIRDDRGNVTHVVTVSVDVTDLKHAEAAALAAKEEAELANMAKSEFLANMSHELRTPLNAIIGFSEMMVSQAFGPIGHEKYAEYAADVHASGTHLHEIITDLLDVSRIEVGAINLDLADVDLGAIVESVCTMLERKAERAGVALVDRCERPLPTVRGDRVRLRQIFINLVDNAIKFTDPGGEVVIDAGLERPDQLVVSVRDTGIGISREDIDRVVEPFVLLQSSATRNVSGTGLGLSLVKSLAELHGGSLAIDSEPGHGTVARVTLPCRPPLPRTVSNRRIA